MTWPAGSAFAAGAFHMVLFLAGAYALLLIVLLAGAMVRARSLAARQAVSARVRPALEAALVEYLAGGTNDSVLRRYYLSHPDEVAASLLRYYATVGGSARDALCNLALELDLVRKWCREGRSRNLARRRAAFANLAFACSYEPCRRVAGDLLVDGLEDPDEEVRLSACRGVVLSGDEDLIEGLFDLATEPDLMTRIALTEDLRRYALQLAAGPACVALSTGDASRVRATLEILVAWDRAIPVEPLPRLLGHADREIRTLALRLAAFASVAPEARQALVNSLQDTDAEIRGLAIRALGRQKVTEAIPELAFCLRHEGLEVARLAAAALAAMPPLGWHTLEELSASPTESTALAAGEAMARVRAEV